LPDFGANLDMLGFGHIAGQGVNLGFGQGADGSSSAGSAGGGRGGAALQAAQA
jgi:hypothetical protein